MHYIAKKLCLLIVTLLIVSMLAFLAFQVIPGDPTTKILGTDATPERVAELQQELGLGRPVIIRYFNWFVGFITGDLGRSYSYSSSVSALMAEKIPITLALSAVAFVLVVLISIPLGVMTAWREGGVFDRILTVVNHVFMAIPPFFIGIVFTFIFGVVLKFFTPGSFIAFSDDPLGFLVYIFFAALAIALPRAAMTIKLLRSSILDEMKKDYIRTAYSRGNSRRGALRLHALKNAIIPVVTFLAMTLADIVAGSIIVEQVFSIPGIGRLLLTSISNRDYPVVQASVVFIAFIVIIVNFLADIVNQYIDPRIRLS